MTSALTKKPDKKLFVL